MENRRGEKMHCRKCGYKSNLEGETCLRCGALLDEEEQSRLWGAEDEEKSQYEELPLKDNTPQESAENTSSSRKENKPIKQKSRLVAGLLQMFFGGFGAGRFYLGYTGVAVGQLCTVWLFGIGYIWGFIDGVLILCRQLDVDADGVPLKG